MNVDAADLDAATRALAMVNSKLLQALSYGRVGRLEQAADQTEEARQAAWKVAKKLERLGAAPAIPAERTGDPTPLHLLAALEAARDAAAEVDEERGHAPEDGFSAVLAGFAADRQTEIYGMAGAGRE